MKAARSIGRSSPAGVPVQATRRNVRPHGGFTLIEILIVVVILGILAAIVIPQFTTASRAARENTLKEDLRYLRTQILAFRLQHRDVPPGFPGGNPSADPNADTFMEHMTRCSDEFCNTSGTQNPAYPFGPYLTVMPYNPLGTHNGVWVVSGATMPDPDPAQPFGWIYNPHLQKLIVNQPGRDSAGVLFSTY